MEKIAIISDIHGCCVSLETVLKDIEQRGIKRIFMLGDIVSKGSHPKEALETIRKKCEIVIKGNCDDIIGRNKCTTKEHLWNYEKIGKENAKYLANLPLYYDFYMSGLKIRLIHASPETMYESINYYQITEKMNEELKNMFNNTDFLNNINKDNPDIVIFGHIHSPFMYRVDNKLAISVGSVSNSCDIVLKNEENKLMSSYMILEGEYNSKEIGNISYEFVRLPFNHEKEIEYLKNSDMPNKEMAIEEITTGIYVRR